MLGFLSAIGGALSAAISTVGGAIGTALSGAGTFLVGVVAKIGPVLSEYAGRFLSVIAKIPEIDLPTLIKLVDIAGKLISAIGELLGINSDEDMETLGAKAAQAEKTIDDFDDTQAYIEYLKNEIKLDQEKFNQMSEAEKMGCKAAGIALETKAVEEKIGEVSLQPEFVAALAKIRLGSDLALDAKEVIDIINGLKKQGFTDMNEVTDYLEGKGGSNHVEIGMALKSVIKTIAQLNTSDNVVEVMKQSVRRFGENS